MKEEIHCTLLENVTEPNPETQGRPRKEMPFKSETREG